MADMRVLPGMEGGLVTDASGALVGALWLLLYSGQAAAEVPLVVPAGVLAAALADALGGPRPPGNTHASKDVALQAGSSAFAWVAASEFSEPHAINSADGGSARSASARYQLARAGVSGHGAAETYGAADPQRRRLAAMIASLEPVPAAGPANLAPALALAQRGVVGVVAAGGRWASGVVVNP